MDIQQHEDFQNTDSQLLCSITYSLLLLFLVYDFRRSFLVYAKFTRNLIDLTIFGN